MWCLHICLLVSLIWTRLLIPSFSHQKWQSPREEDFYYVPFQEYSVSPESVVSETLESLELSQMFAVLVEVCALLVCYMVRQEMVQNVTLQPHDYKDSYCKSRAKYQETKKQNTHIHDSTPNDLLQHQQNNHSDPKPPV